MARTFFERRVGEAVVIGDVRIELVEMRGGACRLAIQAPDAVRISRAELIERDCPTVRRKARYEPD